MRPDHVGRLITRMIISPGINGGGGCPWHIRIYDDPAIGHVRG